MPVLKIVGYETGKKKMNIASLLQDRLGLEGEAARDMLNAVTDGRGISLTIDNEETAAGLGQELIEAGARVSIEGE